MKKFDESSSFFKKTLSRNFRVESPAHWNAHYSPVSEQGPAPFCWTNHPLCALLNSKYGYLVQLTHLKLSMSLSMYLTLSNGDQTVLKVKFVTYD